MRGSGHHKYTIFKKSVSWKSISNMMKEKKEREAQSKRDKKRAQAQKEQEAETMLTGDDILDALLSGDEK